MQATVDKRVSAKFESVKFKIRLRQTVEDVVSSPQYFLKMTEELLDNKELLDPVAHVVKMKAATVIEISWKHEKRIKILPRP